MKDIHDCLPINMSDGIFLSRVADADLHRVPSRKTIQIRFGRQTEAEKYGDLLPRALKRNEYVVDTSVRFVTLTEGGIFFSSPLNAAKKLYNKLVG